MKVAEPNNRNRPLSEINIIPLVDVILVLLIVFMITAPLLQQGLDVELPETAAAAMPRGDSDIIAVIDKNGKIFIQNDRSGIGMEELLPKLERIYRHRDKKEIFLEADKKVSYGFIADALSIMKRAGIDRVGLVTQQPKEEKKKK